MTVAEKDLERVELRVHRVEKPIVVKAGDEYLSLGYFVDGVRLAGVCQLHHRGDFKDGRLILFRKSFPPGSPGIDVWVGIEGCHF